MYDSIQQDMPALHLPVGKSLQLTRGMLQHVQENHVQTSYESHSVSLNSNFVDQTIEHDLIDQ